MLSFPSADHESGSGPAYQQAAITTRLLACRGKSSCRCQQSKKPLSSEDVPVRLLEYRERTLKLSSADHDGGSGPAQVGRHSRLGCLQAQLRAVGDVAGESAL